MHGQTEENTMVTGKTTAWTAMEFTNGKTDAVTKDNIRWIRKKERVHINGQMEGCI